ncbi:BTB/POZ and TAZ domain-containing protein 2-like [Phoenix dactylifera]|uniref:BTB/POZ and TAZ domain-containing protein 2-like n=1 Tax=Phoenix dactylifera TaxID=42345 RepID=A0A8B7MSP5_PHODC|nr:BTB/POZ and TAZ domain-containing protein 2-like [Phoenix dactylifera]
MRNSADCNSFRRWHEAGNEFVPPADVQIVTSGGRSIPAHSAVLASASPVLEKMLYRCRIGLNSQRIIQILGVPCDAVVAFIQFFYSSRSVLSSREGEEAMERYGIHLLVLSHAYQVKWLKRGCEEGVAARLRAEEVVDVLKLAKLCDAPRLYQRCMRLVAEDLASAVRSEGWRFIQRHDPLLEQEILQLVEDADQRKKRWMREMADQEMYQQLSEAMESLQHICTVGCTVVGPHNGEPPSRSKGPCSFRTCEGLQLLIRHFATCGKKLSPGGCIHCRRMSQLFQLHSSICDQSDSCKVPLCKQFKSKMQMDGKVDKTWRLLVKKVVTARVMSSLAKRKGPEEIQKTWLRYTGTK